LRGPVKVNFDKWHGPKSHDSTRIKEQQTTTIVLKKPTAKPKLRSTGDPKIPTSDARSPGRASLCPSMGHLLLYFQKNPIPKGQPRGRGTAQLKLTNPLSV